MNSVDKFNALNGKIVSKEALLKLMTQAFDEQQFEVHRRIIALLDTYPEAVNFELEITPPAVFDVKAHDVKKSLSGPKKAKIVIEKNKDVILDFTKEINALKVKRNKTKKNTKRRLELELQIKECESRLVKDEHGNTIGVKFTEVQLSGFENSKKALNFPEISKEMLAGIPYAYIKEDSDGLGKPVSPEQIYDMITKLIIDAIKENKNLVWRKTWQSEQYGIAASNYVSKKAYRGINAILLNFIAPLVRKKEIVNPYWLTFKQIERLKGSLKKGSKGHEVIYYAYIYKITQEEPKISFTSVDPKKFNKFIEDNKSKINDTAKVGKIPVLKYYKVFSADDIEGINFKMPPIRTPKEVERIAVAESIVENMPNPPKLKLEDKGDSAHYSPSIDSVTMPKLSFFDGAQEYYSTYFHELIHATGSPKRLNRDLSGTFGTKNYAFEELIAELGAVFLCGESGILYHTINNSAAYIKGWRKRLLNELEEDNKFIFRAASASQMATDFILDRDKKGVPKYLRVEKKPIKTVEKPTPVKSTKNPKQTALSKFHKSCKEELADSEFEKTKHKFKPGDIYRSDFDYKGMLEAGLKVTDKTPLKTIEKLYNSFSDVNYHSQANYLWEIMEASPKEAQLALFGKLLSRNSYNKIKKKNRSATKPKPATKQLGTVLIDTNPDTMTAALPNALATAEPLVIDPADQSIEDTTEAPIEKVVQRSKINRPANKYIQNVKDTKAIANSAEYFDLEGAFIDFTGKLEQKTDDSLVITLDAPPGAGKTRSVFQFLNIAANSGIPSIFASLEEHPSSKIFHAKREMYITPHNEDYIDTIGELPPSYDEFLKLIESYQIIAIDSWNKVFETYKGIDFDRDLRKAFNGKIIIAIFQRTGTGQMRGGSKAGFDGDIILEIVKADDYKDSYVIARKNRYQDTPLNEIAYSFYHQKVINPELLASVNSIPTEITV